jgi:serine/threonine-protein kinase
MLQSAMVVHVAKADLSMLAVDAIVVPSSSHGTLVGQAGAAVRLRGGDGIQDEARALAPIAIGAAIVTGPGRLFCQKVIHVPVVEEPGMRVEIENARRATRAGLIAASVHGFLCVGIAGIGAGAGGLTHEEAARAIVDEVRGHKNPKPSTVYLVDLDEYMLRAFEDALRQAQ